MLYQGQTYQRNQSVSRFHCALACVIVSLFTILLTSTYYSQQFDTERIQSNVRRLQDVTACNTSLNTCQSALGSCTLTSILQNNTITTATAALSNCNAYMTSNQSLAAGYANGTYLSIQTAFGLGSYINALKTTNIGCPPSIAICSNYPFSTVSSLRINSTSCSQCNAVYSTCAVCIDKNSSKISGTSCAGCTVKVGGTIGSCSACSVCTPISTIATCPTTSPFLTLSLNGTSCTACYGTTCNLCSDQLIFGNFGSTCSGCTILSGSVGVCTFCSYCSSATYTASCAYPNSIKYLNLYYTSCSGCNGTTCSLCNDNSKNGNYGIQCTMCTTNGTFGYCGNCLCLPVFTRASCSNINNLPLNLKGNSCSGCNNIGGTITCSRCVDFTNNGYIGQYCSNCVITNGTMGFCTGYCSICTPVWTLASCSNNMEIYITMSAQSCQGCSSLGSSTKCSLCKDSLINVTQGINCTQCTITNVSKGYCTSCLICTPFIGTASCSNGKDTVTGYFKVDQYSCNNCTTIGSNVMCGICVDSMKSGVVGTSCTSCTIVGKSGYCLTCSICTPVQVFVTCNNDLTLNLNDKSCTGCTIIAGITTCTQCKDKSNNGNQGTACTNCLITDLINGIGYCSNCGACTPTPTFTVSYRGRKISLKSTSCQGCSGSTCANCTDTTGNGVVGFNCNSCVTYAGGSGYCTFYCTLFIPTNTYVACWSGVVSRIAVNMTSCSNCIGSSCAKCSDITGNGAIGYNCNGCSVAFNNTGYCEYCTVCTPVKVFVGCRGWGSKVNRVQLNATSCSNCSGSTCATCTDYRGNGIVGINCDGCTIISSNKGYCNNYCMYCTPIYSIITCQNSGVSIARIIANENSCSECIGTNCNVCVDISNNGNIGYNCRECMINGSIGYCTSCAICAPVYTAATCQNSNTFLNINQNLTSCSDCSGTSCAICIDRVNPAIIGRSCSSCTIFNTTFGYCSSCKVCSSS